MSYPARAEGLVNSTSILLVRGFTFVVCRLLEISQIMVVTEVGGGSQLKIEVDAIQINVTHLREKSDSQTLFVINY